MKPFVNALAVAVLLASAGCAGGSPAGGTLPAATRATPPGNVTLSFQIPARRAASAQRIRPRYVSASTASVTVGIDGGAAAAVSVNCTASACSVTFPLAPGSHTLAVRLWDASNGGGNELASNTAATCTIVGDTANTCSVTLFGLARSISVTSSSANVSGSQAGGFSYVSGAATPFTIVALDADGNSISGVGAIVPSVSTAASGISIATPAPNASPSAAAVYAITDTDTSPATVAVAATPAPNSDGSPVSSNVTLTGAGLFAASLFFFSGSTFDVVSATTGQTTLSITSPLSGAPFAAAIGSTVLLNAAGNASLSIFDLGSDTITHTIASGCTSSDNVPIAADSGRFFYDCGGTVRAYDTSGTLLASWADGESNTGFIAAGGGNVYTISGTTIHVFDDSGNPLTSFAVAAAPSPQWAFAASANGLFVGHGTSMYVYSSSGSLATTLTVSHAAVCDIQPVGNFLTVRVASRVFNTYSIATGQLVGTVTTTATPSDCRVGFSN